jgi:tRNA(fMet)-specific endonuclease VapC
VIIADTDVLVDFLRNREPMADRIAVELTTGSFVTTVITEFELRSGIRSRRETTAVEALLNALDVFSLDPPAARRASEVRRALESKGQTIGMADSLIAGICLERDGVLLTRNVKHYSRVDGLILSGKY